MEIRFIKAGGFIEFSECGSSYELFEKEYYKFGEVESDSITQWLNLSKAKKDIDNTDPILLQLILELHKKVDRLEEIITHKSVSLLHLDFKIELHDIGFEHIKLNNLKVGHLYYARIDIPIFPKRLIPIFFEAVDTNIALIKKIHQKDEQNWDSYIVSKEREYLREIKR